MKIPPRLIPLVEDGIIDEVLAQVKSGKEADVFVVRVGEEIRCAKVYKEANNRSFRQSVQYQEGRKVQNSRSTRAMSKRTRYGQKEAESSWINAEVEALNKLSAAGIRVPTPFGFFDGVLIMELILGEDGQPAPRLNDLSISPDLALLYHEELISQIVRMLCSGIIHGDLSEFNVLVDAEGPVIIDLPQAVNAAGNSSAAMMFARDVDNMARYFGRFEPGILGLKYAKEIWALYEKGKLTPHVELTGKFQEPTKSADVVGTLSAIGDARKEHEDKILKKAQARDPKQGDLPPRSWNPREPGTSPPSRNQGGPRQAPGQGYGGQRQPPRQDNGNQRQPPRQDNGNQRQPPRQDNGNQRQPPRQDNGNQRQPPRQDNGNQRQPPRQDNGNQRQPPRQDNGNQRQPPRPNHGNQRQPPTQENKPSTQGDAWGRRPNPNGNPRNRPS
jgi:RIO kinase 1